MRVLPDTIRIRIRTRNKVIPQQSEALNANGVQTDATLIQNLYGSEVQLITPTKFTVVALRVYNVNTHDSVLVLECADQFL